MREATVDQGRRSLLTGRLDDIRHAAEAAKVITLNKD